MQLTIIKDDDLVAVDGVFKTVDLSSLAEGIRAVQWDGETGHIEYYDPETPNLTITDIDQFSGIVDIYNLPPQDPVVEGPTTEEMIAAANARINAEYTEETAILANGYPANTAEIVSLRDALTNKWQGLRDDITALGVSPTQEQLDAIQW